MGNKLMEAMKNQTFTENGSPAYKSTTSGLLDMFALGGSYRNRTDVDIRDLVDKAYKDCDNPSSDSDLDMMLRCIMYLRDIRGGQGERRFAREALLFLMERHTDKTSMTSYIIRKIPEYGRWDDVVWIALHTKSKFIFLVCMEVIKLQLDQDALDLGKGKSVSLLGKWMPSERASSWVTASMATEMYKYLGLTPKEYRKGLVALRKRINLVETKMSQNDWGNIKYDTVPSQAMLRYKTAFFKHDETRYKAYLEDVKSGEKTINTSTLYPYQICKNCTQDGASETLWNNLPNYINARNKNALVMADVSGSMTWGQGSVMPIDVAVSLALYFAERCEGAFHNYFMTFETNPHLIEVKGSSLYEKFSNIRRAPWGGSTDVNAAFQLLLDTAVKNNIPEDEMPKIIYIISDMQFDYCCQGLTVTNYDHMVAQYQSAGYEIPHVVFWNVNARVDNVPVSKDEIGTTLVSGSSPIIFSFVVEGKTPFELMVSVLNSDRYNNLEFGSPDKTDVAISDKALSLMKSYAPAWRKFGKKFYLPTEDGWKEDKRKKAEKKARKTANKARQVYPKRDRRR